MTTKREREIWRRMRVPCEERLGALCTKNPQKAKPCTMRNCPLLRGK